MFLFLSVLNQAGENKKKHIISCRDAAVDSSLTSARPLRLSLLGH